MVDGVIIPRGALPGKAPLNARAVGQLRKVEKGMSQLRLDYAAMQERARRVVVEMQMKAQDRNMAHYVGAVGGGNLADYSAVAPNARSPTERILREQGNGGGGGVEGQGARDVQRDAGRVVGGTPTGLPTLP